MNKKLLGFIKYACCSLSTTAIDLGLFYFFLSTFSSFGVESPIFISSVMSRIISAFIFYVLLSNYVFKPEEKSVKRLIKHFVLEVVKLISSASLLTFVDMMVKGNPVIEKCFVDTFLFTIFYFAQKLWVFKGESSY